MTSPPPPADLVGDPARSLAGSDPSFADPAIFARGPAPATTLLDYASLPLPGRRWWKPFVSVVILVWAWGTLATAVVFGFGLYGFLLHSDPGHLLREATVEPVVITPGVLLLTNLILACGIPATFLAARIVHGLRPGFVNSVAGKFRWGLAGRLALLLLPVFVLNLVVQVALSGGFRPNVDPRILAFLIVVWLTTPLQCAGEEYVFRSWFLQNLGGLFRHPVVRWAMPIVPSSLLFAALHGSMHPWILIDLTLFATAAALIVWRTGGMEAAVVLHSLNNVLVIHLTLVFGGLQEAFVSEESTGSLVSVLFTLVSQGLCVALVWWWAKRRGVQRDTLDDPRVPRRQGSRG